MVKDPPLLTWNSEDSAYYTVVMIGKIIFLFAINFLKSLKNVTHKYFIDLKFYDFRVNTVCKHFSNEIVLNP